MACSRSATIKPCKYASQVQTDRKRPSTVGSNVAAIGGSEGVLRWTAMILAVGRKNTDSACVD